MYSYCFINLAAFIRYSTSNYIYVEMHTNIMVHKYIIVKYIMEIHNYIVLWFSQFKLFYALSDLF